MCHSRLEKSAPQKNDSAKFPTFKKIPRGLFDYLINLVGTNVPRQQNSVMFLSKVSCCSINDQSLKYLVSFLVNAMLLNKKMSKIKVISNQKKVMCSVPFGF